MKTLYLSLIALFIISCDSESDNSDNCVEYLPAGIETVVENPTADAATFLFNVAFRVTNGCGQFYSFEQTIVGNSTTIQLIAKYEGCFCTEDTPLRETVYTFNPTFPGTYTLKFKMLDDNYITKTVIFE